MFRIFGQVQIGEIGKKDVQNDKKQLVNNGFYEEFWISNVYIFLEKCFMIFQKSLIKSLIHKLKKHKQETKMSKMIKKTNSKQWIL